MSTTEIFEAVKSHIASKTTADLIEMLALTDDRAVAAHISDEIERRHPEVTAAADVWAEDLETTDTYLDIVRRVLA